MTINNLVLDIQNNINVEANKTKLIAQITSFVGSIAHKYSHTSTPLEDLMQLGFIGVLRAIPKYDAAKGAKFTTYAYGWARGEMMRHSMRYATIYAMPSYLSESSNAVYPHKVHNINTIMKIDEELATNDEILLKDGSTEISYAILEEIENWNQFPEDIQYMLIKNKVFDWSYNEIAKTMPNISKDTVGRRINQALALISTNDPEIVIDNKAGVSIWDKENSYA